MFNFWLFKLRYVFFKICILKKKQWYSVIKMLGKIINVPIFDNYEWNNERQSLKINHEFQDKTLI